MPGFEIEGSEELCHPVNSLTKENEERYENISVSSSKHKKLCLKRPFGVKRTTPLYVVLVSVILALVIVLILTVRKMEPSPALLTLPALLTCPVVSCPNGWVGYQRKCYHFAKEERNWTSSKWHCSSLNASLALVDSQEEMEFMMRYKGPMDHWIGLIHNLNQSWTWINGTTFNGWFPILGGGSCAYMNHLSIASSSCSSKEPYICNKPIVR